MITLTVIYALLLSLLYWAATIIYNLFFSPLSKLPGRRTWSASRLPFVLSLLRGELIHDLEDMHRRYGPIVRIAPDEVAFSHPDAWAGMLQPRGGKDLYLKDAIWWSEPSEDSMITAINPQAHARMRRTLAPAFSERALKAQEPIVSRYVNLLVEKLREPVQANGGSAVVDVFPFLNYATFDIFGDLGFGESFSCLETGGYHPWIKLIFDNVKFLGFVNGMKYFPTFEWLLKKCIPPSLKKMQQDHHQHIVDKVRRRMNWEASREDIMSHTLKESKGGSGKGMSQQEIEFTFSGLAVAASETTATALAGILNLLSAAPKERDILAEEVHSALSQAPDITPSGLVDLPYLNAVIEEGLRLCPPIPWVLPRRVPPGGDNLCGVWLPGGTAVSISQYAMNRDPFLFHDVAAFHPERWLPEGKVSTSPFCKDRRDCLQPFSVGPRSCIGKKTAYAEMRLILAKILWEFDIEERVGGAIDWASLRTFLLVEKLPIEVKLSLRAHK